MKGKQLLIYLHIPKTGGTTLTNVIEQQYQQVHHYKEEDVAKLQKELQVAEALCGHIPFGAHRYITRPFTYITMLRDPVEQVISWFYYRHQSPYLKKFPGSLDDYLHDDQFNLTSENLQTRFICGDDPPSFKRAKANLKNYFSVVGITELYTESLFLMKKNLNWREFTITKMNVNQNRPLKNDLSKATIEKIREKNHIDLKVYDYAKQRLLQELAGFDLKTKKELALFKKTLEGDGP